jgi:opacity protein-like surface antigen
MKTTFAALFSFLLFAAHASAQSPVESTTGRTVNVGLGYAYVDRADSYSNRLGLQGADASLTVGYSLLALKADVGYARAGNAYGTGQHSDVFSYLAGPIYYPLRHRKFAPYVQALAGATRISGPIPAAGGTFILGGWATDFAWAAGGGIDYGITESLAIRTGVDYMRTEFLDQSLAVRGQSNIRAIAGLVYSFGRSKR